MKTLVPYGILAGVLALFCAPAFAADPVNVLPTPCGMSGANYSGTVTTGSATLIPAPPSGIVRTGIFIELLTASATLGINPTGGTASTSVAGNIVIGTGATSPSNVAYINFAAMGFIPQTAITAIASGSSAVTAYACPK